MSRAWMGVLVQVLLMVIVVIAAIVIGNNSPGALWMYVVGGAIAAFLVYSLTDGVIQKLVGIPHQIRVRDNLLVISNSRSEDVILEEKLNRLKLNTKAEKLKGGKVKHINIVHGDDTFHIIENWVSSTDDDMKAFLEWHKIVRKKEKK